jgi:hypothetical protein
VASFDQHRQLRRSNRRANRSGNGSRCLKRREIPHRHFGARLLPGNGQV